MQNHLYIKIYREELIDGNIYLKLKLFGRKSKKLDSLNKPLFLIPVHI